MKLTALAEFSHEAWFAVTQTRLFVAGASVLTLRTRRLTPQPPESISAVWGATNISQMWVGRESRRSPF